jgi:predicted RNA-binding Zn-ribbon protein involved in translation (DUF1610 family)/uncharacterized membrane protein YtjA (UPF0391 family)
MAQSDDVKELDEITKKIKDTKNQYYAIETILCIVTLIAVVFGSSGGSEASAGFIVAAICFFISMALYIYSNSVIKKHQKEGWKKIVEIGIKERARSGQIIDIMPNIEESTNFPGEITSYQPSQVVGTETNRCRVCDEELKPLDQIFYCPNCQYKAHEIHLLLWFETHNTCPNCGNEISTKR